MPYMLVYASASTMSSLHREHTSILNQPRLKTTHSRNDSFGHIFCFIMYMSVPSNGNIHVISCSCSYCFSALPLMLYIATHMLPCANANLHVLTLSAMPSHDSHDQNKSALTLLHRCVRNASTAALN
jgi:hypothetical protein